MDTLLPVTLLLLGVFICWGGVEVLRSRVQKRLDREFDRGFRAGRHPEGGGWVYLLASDEIVTEVESLPPEPEKAPGHFVPVYR